MIEDEGLPAPLVPSDVDLRDFPSMLLDVARLRDSTLASDEEPEACWAAVLLWAASWHQLPASSIPDDDRWIAKAAGYAIRGKIDRSWLRVRDGALRKFVKCRDGRLYHPVVAEKALECWLSKLAARLSSGAGNAKRHKIEFDPKPIEAQILVARTLLTKLNPQSRALSRRKHSAPSPGLPDESGQPPVGSPDGSPSGSQEKDKGREGNSSVPIGTAGAGAPAPVDKSTTPEEKRSAWNGCGKWMVANGVAESTARELMGALIRDYPQVALDAMLVAPKQAETPDPKAYLIATAKTLAGERSKPAGMPHPVPSAAESAAEMARRQVEFDAANTPEERERVRMLLNEAKARREAALRGEREAEGTEA